MITKPNYKDTPGYVHYFMDLVKTEDLLQELKDSQSKTLQLLDEIPESRWSHRYDEGKWCVREVFRHILDAERVYQYRAFRFSRFDSTELAAFDVNNYISKAGHLDFSIEQAKREFDAIRLSSIALFEPMTDDMLDFKGVANGVDFTARGLGYMAVGHNIHHCNVVRELYL